MDTDIQLAVADPYALPTPQPPGTIRVRALSRTNQPRYRGWTPDGRAVRWDHETVLEAVVTGESLEEMRADPLITIVEVIG